MKRTLKLDANGLRRSWHWPKLTAEQQQTIRDYLSWYYASADDAADKFKVMARGSADPTISLNAEMHWRNVCSAIAWLLSHVENRQRYLECQLAMQEGRFKLENPGPAISSLPAETESPLPPTAGPAKAVVDSPRPTGRSKRRSRKRTPAV